LTQTPNTNKVGLVTATSLVVGNMIASGVFMLPATLAAYGSISLIGWIISGLGAMSLAIVYAWLSRIRPAATGGPYAYTRDGLGDFAGFLVAWGYWISVWATNAAIAVAFVSYLGAFIPALAASSTLSMGTGLAALWILTWVNSIGIREAGYVQVVTTILKTAPLVLIAVGGLFYLNMDHFFPFNRSEVSVLSAITTTTTLTLFAFLGLECATIPAESIRDSGNTVPKATVIGTLISTLVYTVGTIAVMGIIPPAQLQVSQAPFADAAASIWGEPARYLVAGAAVISTFGALNGWILIQGQMPLAAARDKLLPDFFARVNAKGVPVLGIVISSVLVSLLMLTNFTETLANTYTFMILVATFTCLIAYSFSTVSYAILLARDRRLTSAQWFKLLVTFAAFVFSIWAIIGSGEYTVYWCFILLLCGIPFYAWMKMKQHDHQPR
jgi:basic amino acid/polyamine antiporter, APA family